MVGQIIKHEETQKMVHEGNTFEERGRVIKTNSSETHHRSINVDILRINKGITRQTY